MQYKKTVRLLTILTKNLLFSLFLMATFFACKTSSSNTTTTSTTHKGEKEFQAYLDRKKLKYKGKKVPNIAIETIDGKTYNLAEMSDKIVLLNFWFAACKPCLTEIPSLNELHDKFHKKEVVILSVSTDKAELVKKIAAEKKMRYRVAADGKNFAELLEVATFPTSFLIDQKGVIQEVFIGASDFDATYTYSEVKPHIERLLD